MIKGSRMIKERRKKEEEVDEAIIMRRFLYSEITCQSHLPDQLE